MTASWKKDLEAWYLEQFRSVCRDFPTGTVEPTEAPDFIIRGDSDTYGIEVTALYRPAETGQQPMQQVERLRKYIVQRAQAIHEARGGPPLYVQAYFSPHARFAKTDVEAFAERLATLVLAADVLVGRDVLLEGASCREEARLLADHSYVRVYCVPGQSERFWAAPSAGFVPDCTQDHLQDVLDGKDARITSYRAKCDRVWLLVVINGFAQSTSLELPPHVLAHCFRSRFDRVFVLKNHRSLLHELRLAPKSTITSTAG